MTGRKQRAGGVQILTIKIIETLPMENKQSVKLYQSNDCSHETTRQLLLGRKVMTNLNSVLKSRDITLPTKVRIVKAMVFSMVTYGCESWTGRMAKN